MHDACFTMYVMLLICCFVKRYRKSYHKEGGSSKTISYTLYVYDKTHIDSRDYEPKSQ